MHSKKKYILLIVSIYINTLLGQTIWNGPGIVFSKNNFSNWLLESNQDRITDNVWLTRADNKGLFNIKNENANPETCNDYLPSDTEWAYGTTQNYQTLDYKPLAYLLDCKLNSIINGKDIVLHLISDDIYIDIKFTSWTSGFSGGGFSYIRSTPQTRTNVIKVNSSKVKLYPNPAKDYIKIEGLHKKYNFKIYNIFGSEIKYGKLSHEQILDVSSLENGTYFIMFDQYAFKRFVKN